MPEIYGNATLSRLNSKQTDLENTDCLALVPTRSTTRIDSGHTPFQVCAVTDDVRQGRYRTEFRYTIRFGSRMSLDF